MLSFSVLPRGYKMPECVGGSNDWRERLTIRNVRAKTVVISLLLHCFRGLLIVQYIAYRTEWLLFWGIANLTYYSIAKLYKGPVISSISLTWQYNVITTYYFGITIAQNHVVLCISVSMSPDFWQSLSVMGSESPSWCQYHRIRREQKKLLVKGFVSQENCYKGTGLREFGDKQVPHQCVGKGSSGD